MVFVNPEEWCVVVVCPLSTIERLEQRPLAQVWKSYGRPQVMITMMVMMMTVVVVMTITMVFKRMTIQEKLHSIFFTNQHHVVRMRIDIILKLLCLYLQPLLFLILS